MKYHLTFCGKWPLFEELVTVFSNIIQQKHVFNAGQLFPSSHVCNDRSFFHGKVLEGERSFFQQN